MLNENVKEYLRIKEEMDALKARQDELKEEIIKEMGSDDSFTADDGTTAKIVTSETFKYEDEPAMINWLKSNGYGRYVIETVDNRPLNKELKKESGSLNEGLKSMYVKTITTKLNVSK